VIKGETVPARIAEWKSKFHILADWEIRVTGNAPGHEPKVTTNPDLPRATFFPWPNDNEPADFYFHEFMHLVLRAWQRLPADQQDAAEETLVRDICKAAFSTEERLASSTQGQATREPHDGWMNAWLYSNTKPSQNIAYMWNPEVRKLAGDWAEFRMSVAGVASSPQSANFVAEVRPDDPPPSCHVCGA